MKTYITILLWFFILLTSCGTNTGNEAELSEETSDTQTEQLACEERSQAVQEMLLSNNIDQNISLWFTWNTYASLSSKCYLWVIIDNDGEISYNILDVATGRTIRSYYSQEKLEKELQFLWWSSDTSLPEFIGLSPEDALALAQDNSLTFRVVERDGQQLPTTKDYRPGRINATVENDIVVSFQVEGE